jgi:hypothetical protein
MRTLMNRILLISACAIGALAAVPASAAQVEVYDRATGEVLPTYRHHGRTYIAGEPGHEYEIRIRNRAGQRLLAVTTVDGVNVITGQTGAVNQSGYILDPYGFTRVEGWRKSMSQTAAFYFTKLSNSYAARTGRPDDVGVIGVALFREQVPCCIREEESRRKSEYSSDAAEAPVVADKRVQRRDGQGNERQANGASEPMRESRARPESKLGTGHGRRENSNAQYADFQRASETPDEVIAIYYDSKRNLVAQGVIPRPQPAYAQQTPRAFPGNFVPDP